jgi:23S rRNA (adenine2503-C2)-methyltransferase
VTGRHEENRVQEEVGKIALLGQQPEALPARLGADLQLWGEPAYRRDQILAWIWERRAARFDEMTDLPVQLRERLAATYSLGESEVAFEARSEDGTVKHLWQLADGARIESVLIPTKERITLCLSSQAGCALGCRFCATGDMGFTRQLDAAEIVEQFRNADRVAMKIYGRPVANVVYMGMGEPFANSGAVFESLSILHRGFLFGARRITVSTVGLIPGIRRLAARREPFGLAVSLHAPDPDLRRELMPVERKYPLTELLEAVGENQARRGRRVSFEYVMIDGVNDSAELARELVARLEGITSYVNLIPYNPIPGRDWQPSPASRIQAFAAILEAARVPVAIRTPRGRDIAAACGQLRLEQDLSGIAG